jgi:hypothetical protein
VRDPLVICPAAQDDAAHVVASTPPRRLDHRHAALTAIQIFDRADVRLDSIIL